MTETPALRAAETPALRAIAPGISLIAGVPLPANKVNGARNANVVVVSGPAGSIVWNGGVSHQHGQQLLQSIQSQASGPLKALIINRAFQDVLFGWSAFAAVGIPVWMHTSAIDMMRRRCSSCLANLGNLLGKQVMAGTRLAEPTQVLTGGMQFDSIGRKLEILDFGLTSGPNDLMLYDRENQVLLSGALIFTNHLNRIENANIAAWIAALNKTLQLPVRVVVPDYGAPAGRNAIIQTRDYLVQLSARVSRLLKDQVGLLELTANGQLNNFSQWDAYAENHPRNLQTVYLQEENALFR
ncbi:MAG: hypothetical protein WBD34_22280 [Burkholderiaceae bacterium]